MNKKAGTMFGILFGILVLLVLLVLISLAFHIDIVNTLTGWITKLIKR